ncbi:MAG: hypothetical protein WBD22_00100 [Pyrinomonadaceae bacterium]
MSKLRIRRLGVLSMAKMYAVTMLAMMLLICIPYGLIVIVFSLVGAGNVGGEMGFMTGGMGALIGVAIMIVLPIVYAIFGFIGGAIGALIYNLFAGIIGGVEIEVENV